MYHYYSTFQTILCCNMGKLLLNYTVNPRIKTHGLKNKIPSFCLNKGKMCGPFIGPGRLYEGGRENEIDDKKHHIFH